MISDFFKNLFNGKIKTSDKTYTSVKPYNTYIPRFFNYSGKSYDYLMYRACIDCISKQIAKLTPTITLTTANNFYKNLKFLLEYKPNEFMTRYEFFYKVTSMLFDKNNCFIYQRIIDGVITGFYPIEYSEIEFVEDGNEIYAKFSFLNRGYDVVIPYSELIHLRRHYNDNELFGSSQTEILQPLFEVLRAIDSGMINSVEASSQLRGVIKYAGVLNQDDLDYYKDRFVKEYMQNDGIGAMDSKADFVPIKVEPKSINASQQKIVLDYFAYNFGVSENLLKGVSTEDEYNAFFELTIEPLLVQMSLELTTKIFNREEIECGNKILLTANKLLFASVSTKTAMAKEIMPLGLFSINEIRDMYGYNPIADGDKHIVSLNYIDLKNAEEYQIGKKKDE